MLIVLGAQPGPISLESHSKYEFYFSNCITFSKNYNSKFSVLKALELAYNPSKQLEVTDITTVEDILWVDSFI